jgi:NAD(P)H-dependent flavin oxidoreductase YrpB (nitropropane dioxygenase family)
VTLPSPLRARLRLPLIAAPMFLVSGPALVKAACRAGVIGAFPTANCRTVGELEAWLADIKAATEGTAPFCPNLIVHRSNPRLADDLAAVLRARPELVITSVGSPEPVLKPLKDAGCLVLADVASVPIDIAKDITAAERDTPDARRWKDIWSAGHSVSGVADVPSVAQLVERTAREYASVQVVKA